MARVACPAVGHGRLGALPGNAYVAGSSCTTRAAHAGAATTAATALPVAVTSPTDSHSAARRPDPAPPARPAPRRLPTQRKIRQRPRFDTVRRANVGVSVM